MLVNPVRIGRVPLMIEAVSPSSVNVPELPEAALPEVDVLPSPLLKPLAPGLEAPGPLPLLPGDKQITRAALSGSPDCGRLASPPASREPLRIIKAVADREDRRPRCSHTKPVPEELGGRDQHVRVEEAQHITNSRSRSQVPALSPIEDPFRGYVVISGNRELMKQARHPVVDGPVR